MMNKNILTLLSIFALVYLNGCKQEKPGYMKSVMGDFMYPNIPEYIKNTEKERPFFIEHYWDCYPYDDTTFVMKDNTEQILADFLDMRNSVPEELVVKSLNKALARADLAGAKTANRLQEIFLHYIDDPISMYFNRHLDIELHKQILKSPHINKADSSRYAYRLKMLRKNMEGKKSTNFSFITPDNKKMTLHSIKANFTILYFYDPDCEACEPMTKKMMMNPDIKMFEKEMNLQMVLIYTGSDEALWRKHAQKLPKHWIVGWDKDESIVKKELYELGAMPTFYLFDKNMKTMKNNPSEDEMMGELVEIYIHKYCKDRSKLPPQIQHDLSLEENQSH
ncbi:MAG: DUF5106 domain-containing protein [Bacteroidaceae bacterium]|nr:DUF5106 domain-containing protein [Bacteroidaceae bacterium]